MSNEGKPISATGQGVSTEAPPPYTAGYGAIPDHQAAPYPPQGQPGYPPQGQPGYPPQGQPGYPPPGQPGYPQAGGNAPPYGQPYPDMKQGPPPVVATGNPQVGTTTTTVITTQPVVAAGPTVYRLGPLPVNVVCWKCHANVVTTTSFSDGAMTWLLAAGICIVGGVFGCCLIPFCMTGTKDVTHACPNCHCILGKYNRL